MNKEEKNEARLEKILERYCNSEDLSTFKKVELKLLLKEFNKNKKLEFEMLGVPLTEDEEDFWNGEISSSCMNIEIVSSYLRSNNKIKNNINIKFNDEILNLFKKAKSFDDIMWEDVKNGKEDLRYKENSCDPIREIVKIVDTSFGEEVLGSPASLDTMEMFREIGHEAPEWECYDFFHEEYDEAYDRLEKVDEYNLEEEITKEAKEFFDFCIYVHGTLKDAKDYAGFHIKDRKIVFNKDINPL